MKMVGQPEIATEVEDMTTEPPGPWQPLRWTVTPEEPEVVPLALRFNLPFCIYLPDATYDVRIGTQVVQVRLEKRWREGFTGTGDVEPAETVQFSEEGHIIAEHIAGSFPPQEGGENVEFDADPTGQARYTQCTVAVSVPADDSTDIVDVLERHALPVVNRVVEVYRDVSGRDYIPTVHLHDVEFVAALHPVTGQQEFSRLFERRPLRLAIAAEAADVIEQVTVQLESGEPVPLHRVLLADVRRDFDDGRYRQAVIGVVVALEALVSDVLRSKLRHPDEEIDELIDENPVGDLMKKPMEEATGWRPSSDNELWHGWIAANGVRRRVVHYGEQIDRVTADEAIGSVKALMDGIAERA
jgi:hypothetical protein